MFDMTYDSGLFRTADQLSQAGLQHGYLGDFSGQNERWLRLYEAKFIHQFDHHFATFNVHDTIDIPDESKCNSDTLVIPKYWVREEDFSRKMLSTGWSRLWIVAVRDITNTTNERTAIFAVLPYSGVGNTCYTLTFEINELCLLTCFVGNANTFCFDWVTRQKVAGTHLNVFILKQLPLLPPSTYNQRSPWLLTTDQRPLATWILPRVLELTYTAWDLEPFAKDCGYDGPSFRWDENRRFLLRCELDAAYFHLYGIARDDVDYIMETFPIVKRKDAQKYGEYRTKRVILEIYDAMADAMHTGKPYSTLLDPPPADPRVAHPPRQAAAG
jgi:hypothetical protein